MGPRPSRYSSTSLAEWEVADSEVMTRARNYRNRLQKTWQDVDFCQIVHDIQRLYLALDVQKLMNKEPYQSIERYFKTAYDTNNVHSIVEAYTSGTHFHQVVNNDLAKMVSTDNLRDIGMSLDAPQDRYYWEGSLDIACILVNHPQLDCCQITEEMTVYRGMTIPSSALKNYSRGCCLMNKTFLSTSKLSVRAALFSESNSDNVGCLCIFTLVPISERRTAIDIENISIFPSEQEVLILPYATFLVQNVKDETSVTSSKRYIIELRECHD